MSLVRPADRIRARASRARGARCPWVAAADRGQPGATGSRQGPAPPAPRPGDQTGALDDQRAAGAKANAKANAKTNEGGT